MKAKLLITVMVGLLLLSFLAISAFAQGIEPSPFHSQVNRLNSLMNNLDNFNRGLVDVLVPPDPHRARKPAPGRVVGRLEDMANQLEVLHHKLMNAMLGVPMKPLPQEIEIVLMDINRSVMVTAKIARMGIRYENEAVRKAFMEVQRVAEMIIQTMEGEWMMNAIYVITPYNETQCWIGLPCVITWDTSKVQGWNVVWLQVVYPDGSGGWSTLPEPNDYTQSTAHYDWVPGQDFLDPSEYCQPFRMKVYTYPGDDPVWGLSGLFKVAAFPDICNW